MKCVLVWIAVPYVASQHVDASPRRSWTRSGVASGSAGSRRFAPLPFTAILPWPAVPAFVVIFRIPSGTSALFWYLRPVGFTVQHGLPAHRPPAGALADRTSPAWLYTQRA